MNIELLKTWDGIEKGTVVSVSNARGTAMVRDGIGKPTGYTVTVMIPKPIPADEVEKDDHDPGYIPGEDADYTG
jgi:hypothetical protein